jgi:hypothetical protein
MTMPHDDELNAAAAAAAEMMKEPVPVRDDWRTRMLEEIESDRDGRYGRWTMRPVTAIAAGVVLMCLGAAGALMISRGRSSIANAPVASAATPAPSMVRFVFVAPGAAQVSVVGDFTRWTPGAVPLRRLNDGRTWIVDVPLVPGRYAYAFVVDGKLEVDPTAPRASGDDFGVANSILMVRGS